MTEGAPYNLSVLDTLLAVLFPLFLILIAHRLLPSFPWSDIRQLLTGLRIRRAHPFSLNRAYNSYSQYGLLAKQEVATMERSYGTIGRTHKHLGFKIGYPRKLGRLKEAVETNTVITEAIVKLASQEFSLEGDSFCETTQADLSRVRESLKHFVRDWSQEGTREREKIFRPILRVLGRVSVAERARMRVLVPGSGLGRLAWEISQLGESSVEVLLLVLTPVGGFITRAVEFSYFMILAMRFLFSPATTKANQHQIQPFAHWFSHQRSNEALFRTISVPDVVPRFSPSLELVEEDFLKIHNSSDKTASGTPGYDFIVTLFFIDTSINIFSTIEKIHYLLRPGGVWINLGPLLWPGSAQARAELSLDELMHVIQEIGFSVHCGVDIDDVKAPRTIECEYTGDKHAMMRWIYRAEFWVATKGPDSS